MRVLSFLSLCACVCVYVRMGVFICVRPCVYTCVFVFMCRHERAYVCFRACVLCYVSALVMACVSVRVCMFVY